MQKKKKQKSSRESGFPLVWMVVLIVLFVEIFMYAWCRVHCVGLRYEIGRAEKTAATLEAQKKDLRIQMAELGSPTRIMAVAEGKLGMTMPRTDQIVVMP